MVRNSKNAIKDKRGISPIVVTALLLLVVVVFVVGFQTWYNSWDTQNFLPQEDIFMPNVSEKFELCKVWASYECERFNLTFNNFENECR